MSGETTELLAHPACAPITTQVGHPQAPFPIVVPPWLKSVFPALSVAPTMVFPPPSIEPNWVFPTVVLLSPWICPAWVTGWRFLEEVTGPEEAGEFLKEATGSCLLAVVALFPVTCASLCESPFSLARCSLFHGGTSCAHNIAMNMHPTIRATKCFLLRVQAPVKCDRCTK